MNTSLTPRLDESCLAELVALALKCGAFQNDGGHGIPAGTLITFEPDELAQFAAALSTGRFGGEAETPPAAGAIDARGKEALSVDCPHCWQKAGKPCIWPETRTRNRDAPHEARKVAALASRQEAPAAAGAAQAVDIEDVLGKQVWFDRKDVKRVIAAIFSSYDIPKGPFGMREKLLRAALAATPAPETAGTASREAPAYKSCRMDDGRCGMCGGDWSVCGCDGMLRRAALKATGNGETKGGM